jgi:hypothetical protein
MSKEHKAALAQGRREARAVKRYLQAIASRKPGRPASSDRLKERIATLENQIAAESDPLKALELRQKRLGDEAALARLSAEEDMAAVEKDFVEYARSYSERKGISYTAWREQGVPAAALKKAGIARTRSG